MSRGISSMKGYIIETLIDSDKLGKKNCQESPFKYKAK